MENNTTTQQNEAPKIDFSNDIFELAVATQVTTMANRDAYDKFEKAMITLIYERLGLKDVPEKYKTFNQFVDAFAQTLMANVQKDVEILNLRRRLAMIGLATTIQKEDTEGTAQKVGEAAADAEQPKQA